MPALQDDGGKSAEATSKRKRTEHLTALLHVLLAPARKGCVSWFTSSTVSLLRDQLQCFELNTVRNSRSSCIGRACTCCFATLHWMFCICFWLTGCMPFLYCCIALDVTFVLCVLWMPALHLLYIMRVCLLC